MRKMAKNEIIEVIHDDYTIDTTPTGDSGEGNVSGTAGSSSKNSSTSLSKLGLGNTFVKGRDKLVEKKIPLIRDKKQKRMQRSQALKKNVNDIVTNREKKTDIDLDTNVTSPWFRQCYWNILD